VKRDQRREARIRKAVMGAQLAAARTVAGLFADPETPAGDPNPDYNDDAEMPWKLASTRTRAALILTQGAMAAERAKRQRATTQVFGMVLMQPRVDSHDEWERMAAAAAAPGKVIDVEVPRHVVQPGPRALGAGAPELRPDLQTKGPDDGQS
jgi:hypothetical protein